MSTFHFILRTPEKELFNSEVNSLSFNSEEGRVQVLPLHAHYATTLDYSPVTVQTEGKVLTFVARSGMFTFDHAKNEGLLVALYAQETNEVVYKNAEEYLAFLHEELAKGDLSDYEVTYLKGEKLAVEKQVKTKL